MKNHNLFLIVTSLISLLCFNESAKANPQAATSPSVVLLSIDGFRWDYIEKHQANHIAHIAKQGVRAKQLTPVYPTKTFPNHLSIITGLLPVNHGIVDNSFCDKTRQQCYKMGDGGKDSSWLSGIPLWNLATLQGVKSATYFWPESDALFNGVKPDYYYHYSKHSDYQARIDQMIFWLKLPPAQRPGFIAGYFSLVDTQGHEFGPDAKETFLAVQKVDQLVGQLAKRIASEVNHPVTLILVSDHGMSAIEPNKSIAIASLGINETDFMIKNSGTRVQLYQKPDSQADLTEVKKQLQNKAMGRFTVLSEDVLAQRGYVKSVRIADIIIETTAPSTFSDHGQSDYLGTHGFAYTQDMAGLFVAQGPMLKQGFEFETASNLDIYPLVAHLLGLKLLGPIDGTDALKKAIVK
ncbi:hypothetical protein PULV_a1829 [Pseudoalteromonas ulvae UL12]|uniref:alkaline phosphatase family protein n=1 Tax=Pseudoalteromonas ulvae TaxID=107327 RepID=UPI00186B649E|nr:ectonucleotide pyrophosphatase/phosphodiesterase [Pseudoalteromonas ulvae]MBE0364233.1 hypothetical protein [Pseudoalteromonas ulvae UL12]